MKQNLIYIGVLIAGATLGSQALAQANKFEGFSLGAGINTVSANFARSYNSGRSSPAISSTHVNLAFQAEYGFAINDKYVIGLGGSMDQRRLVFGTWTASKIDIEMKDMYSVHIAPGYALSDSTLVYAKLGYLSGTVSDPASTTLPGTRYGIGVRVFGGSNVFYQSELSKSEYAHRAYVDATDTFDANALTLSVGYKF